MKRHFSPRRAYIAGGTGNMGRAIVELLSSKGLTVTFSGRDRARGLTLSGKTGAQFYEADANDRRASSDALDRAIGFLGGIDLFVSCTGLVFVGSIQDTPDRVAEEVIEVNLTSVFRNTRTVFSHMREAGAGSIIHIVSDAALRGIHHIPIYSVAKTGLLAMSELFAAEGAAYGVRVNAICPGATVPGVQSTIKGFEHHAEDHTTWGAAPSGRHGTADDVANAVDWLAFGAGHVSGATLRVDGASSAATRGFSRA